MSVVERKWTITWASKVEIDGVRRVNLMGPELVIGWGDDPVEVVLADDLRGAVEVIRDLLPAWLNGWPIQQDIIDRAEAVLESNPPTGGQ